MEKKKEQKKEEKKKEAYKKRVGEKEPKRPVLLNCIKAFFVGGAICAFGQCLQYFFINYFGFDEKTAGNPVVAIIILIGTLLTGFGVFDHIGQWAGAGTSIPVTGFANSITSAAIEHKSEGFVLGTGGNMFKLAGSVIVFGVFSSFVVVLIRMLVMYIIGRV